jgi:monofunctional glycosyltransferase
VAKGSVLKLLLWLLSLPQISVSLLLEVLAPKSIRADLDLCIVIAEKYGASVPSIFVKALIIAEDHRSKLHPGIDVIAMARALWVRVTLGQIQGASTIEQQFVRVVSNRYERTPARKLREQMLALMVVRRVNKQAVASAYLSIAFYGSGSVGVKGLKAQFGEDLSLVSFNQALQMVAQLKYPRPLFPTVKWQSRISTRCKVLISRVDSTANKSLRQTFDRSPLSFRKMTLPQMPPNSDIK